MSFVTLREQQLLLNNTSPLADYQGNVKLSSVMYCPWTRWKSSQVTINLKISKNCEHHNSWISLSSSVCVQSAELFCFSKWCCSPPIMIKRNYTRPQCGSEILIWKLEDKLQPDMWFFSLSPCHEDLFCDLNQQTDLGIVNYGITVTTLEDVFLKLEGNESTDEEGKCPVVAGKMWARNQRDVGKYRSI